MAKNSRAEFVASLERGLRVLQTFSREHPQLTLSEVATLTGSRRQLRGARSTHSSRSATSGRSGRRFLLRPKVLSIGSGYLSAINAEVVLQPFLQDVVNELGGSSSVTVLDDLDIVYIAHASLNRAIRLTAGAGSRYPVYPTSMGRVLLAFQPEAAIDAYFERAALRQADRAHRDQPGHAPPDPQGRPRRRDMRRSRTSSTTASSRCRCRSSVHMAGSSPPPTALT